MDRATELRLATIEAHIEVLTIKDATTDGTSESNEAKREILRNALEAERECLKLERENATAAK